MDNVLYYNYYIFLYRAGAPEEGGRWEVGKQFNIGFCPLALHQLPLVDTLHKLAQSYRLAHCHILALSTDWHIVIYWHSHTDWHIVIYWHSHTDWHIVTYWDFTGTGHLTISLTLALAPLK